MAAKRKITVIGLATFGEELALQLEAAGAEVTGLDIDRVVIQSFRDRISHVGIVDGRDVTALREFEVEKSDLVVVGTRDRLEMSVLILLALKDLKVKNIIALAASKEGARALELIGGSFDGTLRVIFPERDIARREAQLIMNPALSNYLELASGFSFVEIAPPREFIGRNLQELNVRKHYGVNVVALRASRDTSAPLSVPTPEHVFRVEDRVLIIGPNDRIRKLSQDRS